MKKIITLILGIAIMIPIILIAIHFISLKDVSFNTKESNYSITIWGNNGEKIATTNPPSKIRLKKGEYNYTITGEKYDGKSTPFSVTASLEIAVTPRYSSSYLHDQSALEVPKILTKLQEDFPSVSNISIKKITLDTTNTWAYGTLTVGKSENDIYRFIMKRDKDTWSTVATPNITLTINNTSEVPKDIIYSLY
jgi:uncharacterized protein YxeA